MTRREIYNMFFEKCGYAHFWGEILRQKTPQKMSETLWLLLRKKIGLMRSLCGFAIVGYWMSQFAILCDDLDRAKITRRTLRDTTAQEVIAKFRAMADNEREYNR